MSDVFSSSAYTVALAFLVTAGVATLLTAWARWYALKNALFDIPNERSSHRVPTVRGGGISIVACALLGGVLLWVSGAISADFTMAWIGGGLLVGAIGWLDDHGHVAPVWRALCHLAAAAWAVAWLDGLPALVVGDKAIALPWIGHLLAILGTVWLINLFNFMDGIDGIAGSEAVFVLTTGGVLLWFDGAGGLGTLSLILAASCCGFLIWNWPPAKIFMGDVGSGALGFFIAILALAGERASATPILIWLILCGVFVCDATYTLLRRLALRERWYAAHRSHAYQRLVQMGWSHRSVTGTVQLINILIIFPMALAGWFADAVLLWAFLLMCFCGFIVWVLILRRFEALQYTSRP